MGAELPVRITAMYDFVNAINVIHSGQFAKRNCRSRMSQATFSFDEKSSFSSKAFMRSINAGGGTRTHTRLPPTDFESASSTIPTHRLTFKDDSIDSFFLQEKDNGLQRI